VDEITGTLYARRSVKDAPDGRKVFMLFGIVALPEGVEMEEEKIYTVIGQEVSDTIRLNLMMPLDPPQEVIVRSYTVGQLMLWPGMWRI